MIIRVLSETSLRRLNADIDHEVQMAYAAGHFLQDVTMKVTPRSNQNLETHSVLLVFGEIPTS